MKQYTNWSDIAKQNIPYACKIAGEVRWCCNCRGKECLYDKAEKKNEKKS